MESQIPDVVKVDRTAKTPRLLTEVLGGFEVVVDLTLGRQSHFTTFHIFFRLMHFFP
jgi:hypothetical protein